jgi:ParB family chromosome partitioning protein
VSAKGSKGLGRGFESLIPKDFDDSVLLEERDRIKKLFTADIVPNPDQPRKHFDQTSLQELATSIKRHGILQPLVVTQAEDKKYTIIAGERRWRAAGLAGMEQVPAIVRSAEQLEQLEMALIENVQRVDLSPLEQAASIARLQQQFSMSYAEVAGRLGKAVTTVNNIVRLLQLPPAAQLALQERKISEGHARAILALKDEARQLELLQLIQQHKWSVRQAEQYVTAHKEGAADTHSAKKRLEISTPATKKLSSYIKAPVSIKRTAKGGKLEIAFKSDADLERIIDQLQK